MLAYSYTDGEREVRVSMLGTDVSAAGRVSFSGTCSITTVVVRAESEPAGARHDPQPIRPAVTRARCPT